MSRPFDETCQVPFLRVFRWMEKGLWAENGISLLNIMWGWKAKNPSQLKPSWMPHHQGGVEMSSSTRGL